MRPDEPARARHVADTGEGVDAEGEDAALLRAHLAGDDAAFGRLYDRHAAACWRFIRHRLGPAQAHAADDVLQETWISVARAAPRWEPRAKFSTWLFTLARSRVVDHLRAQRAADGGALSLDAPPPGAGGDDGDGADGWADRLPAPAGDEPLARLTTQARAHAFLAALDALPAVQREAFLLQAEGGLSLADVAAATGVGTETAKSRLRYARDRLRGLLADWRPA